LHFEHFWSPLLSQRLHDFLIFFIFGSLPIFRAISRPSILEVHSSTMEKFSILTGGKLEEDKLIKKGESWSILLFFFILFVSKNITRSNQIWQVPKENIFLARSNLLRASDLFFREKRSLANRKRRFIAGFANSSLVGTHITTINQINPSKFRDWSELRSGIVALPRYINLCLGRANALNY
jgi:hypothetical protein